MKSIARAWVEFSASMVGPPDQIEAMRMVFYSGAIFAMNSVASISEMPTECCGAAVESLHDECLRFSESLAVNGQS